MKKIILTAILGIAGIGMCMGAQTKGRVDIGGKVVLKPGKAENGSVRNITWGKSETRKYYITAESVAISKDKWTKFEFSFTPEEDGSIGLSLMSNYSKSKGKKNLNAHWVIYKSVVVKGADIVNGNFQEMKGGKIVGWHVPASQIVKIDGSEQAVKAWHNRRVSQSIKVKKGQTVTVEVMMKADDIEEAAE